jgi:SsrA-binding protein
VKVFNKRARFDYELLPERVEAGVSLLGIEAKAFRDNRIDLSQSFVKILNEEAYLINANISAKGVQKYDSTRMRKLLLHKNEILSLIIKTKQKKLQIVPTMMYNSGKRIKVKLVLGKPKRKFEKKESLKKKDIEREIQTQLKNNY